MKNRDAKISTSNLKFLPSLLAAFVAIATVACNNNKEVFVTDIQSRPVLRSVVRPSSAKDFYTLGQYRQTQGDSRGAIAAYSQAINLNSNNSDAYNKRGLAYFSLGNRQQAIADYNQAIRINPKYAEAYNNRGNARAASGERDAAVDDYSEAIRINPTYAVAYNNRGNARTALGDREGAIADYDEAIRLSPNFAAAYNNRGNARAALGDKEGAMADLQKAAKIFEKQKNQQLYQEVMNNMKELGQ
ncbi:hypothetical protein NUACC21_74020 [Scytonema sp. NUACC21]